MEDGWFEILLHLDIKTISNIYYINHLSYNMCKDKHFWITKFNYDSINIINVKDTISEWIKEYNLIKRLVLKAHNEVHNIYFICDIYRVLLDDFSTYTSIPFLPDKMVKILSEMDKPIYLSLDNIITGNIVLRYKFTKNETKGSVCVDMSQEELEDMFFNIYYYEYTQGKRLGYNVI